MARAHPSRRRSAWIIVPALALIVSLAAPSAGVAGGPPGGNAPSDDATAKVMGETFNPAPLGLTPDQARDQIKATASIRSKWDQARSAAVEARQLSRSGARLSARMEPRRTAVATVASTSGMAVFGFPAVNVEASPSEATAGVVGSSMVAGAQDRLYAYTLDPVSEDTEWVNSTFFAIPANEAWWGSVAGGSMYRGRFVVALPSVQATTGCANGYLNLAVSTSKDPLKPWTRFRIPVPGAWTDRISIGISDDKVVLAVNQWGIDPTAAYCIGTAWDGGTIRVVDWTDLLDGGTITVRRVSPTPRADYYGWQAASVVPGRSSTAGGTAVHLVASKFVSGVWGHVAYGLVTGSAKAGTAAFTSRADLTTGGLGALIGPPPTLAAFTSGNGYQDERPISAVWRADRLWFSANDTCRPPGDTADRACARFVELDTSVSPPVVVDSGDFGATDADAFHPIVGMSRSGLAYFGFSGSSATTHAPIDLYAAYRTAGNAIEGGAAATAIHSNLVGYSRDLWASVASIVPDPADPASEWYLMPNDSAAGASAWATRLTGGLTGDPGGTFILDWGRSWINSAVAELRFAPDRNSPIVNVRVSNSPQTETTPGGLRLVYGLDLPSGPWGFLDMQDPTFGGAPGEGVHTVYVQWITGDGRLSAPISASVGYDHTLPVLRGPFERFQTGAVGGTTARIRTWWSASDSLSGVSSYWVNRTLYRSGSTSITLPTPLTTSIVESLSVGKTYWYEVVAYDAAGNSTQFQMGPAFRIRVTQQSSTSIHYYSTWTSVTSTSYLGGSDRYSTKAGARATYTFTGRAIGIVSTRGPGRGKAEVWVDGVKRSTIDLYAAGTHYRQLVWEAHWVNSGTHTVQLRVLGTPGRPRVDLDAFVTF